MTSTALITPGMTTLVSDVGSGLLTKLYFHRLISGGEPAGCQPLARIVIPDRHLAAEQEEVPDAGRSGLNVEKSAFSAPWSWRILVRWNRPLFPSGDRFSPTRA